jgi:hypothetical protein
MTSHSKTVITSQSVIWIVTAFFLLLLPQPFLTFFGAPPSPLAVAVARIFGAELTGLALVSWFTRIEADPRVLPNILFSYVASNTLGVAVTLYATAVGALNTRAWFLAALYLLYALAFIYLYAVKRKPA